MKLTVLLLLLASFVAWIYVTRMFPVPLWPRIIIPMGIGFTFGVTLQEWWKQGIKAA